MESQDAKIEKNIRETIAKMKRRGTTGASIACLFQNTPTTGVTVPPNIYRHIFVELAKEVAIKRRFSITQ